MTAEMLINLLKTVPPRTKIVSATPEHDFKTIRAKITAARDTVGEPDRFNEDWGDDVTPGPKIDVVLIE